MLGPLEVMDGDRRIDLGGSRQRALLAILLLRRNEVVSPDRLIDDLYGAHPPATATKSLQAHVSRVRRALGNGARLQTRAGGYVLELDPDEVDADRAARLLAEARRARAAGDNAEAARSLEAALRLWRGSPLAELVYNDFARDEIERLEELRLECLEERMETELELGGHTDLTGELETLVAAHPLRERVRRQLMLALYRCDRQADALAVYQDGRRLLLEELGLEPGRPLQELERAILNHDPSLDPPPAAPGAVTTHEGPAARRGSTVFVGRERELVELEAALGDALAGHGRLALLTGDAGIGKSRLADELASRARTRGARVLWGRCWEAGGAPAYWPWVQALRTQVRELDAEELRRQLGAGTPELVHLLPELRARFPDVPEPHDLETEGARFRLFDAMATFLRNAAEETPLVLVLDDLHVADAPSLLMLEFVAASIAEARVLLLAIRRDPDVERDEPEVRGLQELGRLASVRVALAGLAAHDVVAYVTSTVDSDPPKTVTDAIFRETEGNPLFVGEVVRLLAAEGLLDGPLPASWHLTVPRGVREVIERRLQHVSPTCLEALAFASVLGREFDLDALERLSGMETHQLLDVLDQAASARVVTDVPATPGRRRFAHALIRDTLYDGLPTARRVEMHRRAAKTLAELYAHDLEPHLTELAHHAFLAAPGGDVSTAIDLARKAGDHASLLLAHEEAARLYELALSARRLNPRADGALECDLQLALGDALASAGDMPRAKDAFLRAASLARSLGDTEALAAAALGYGGRIVWARAGNDRLVVSLLEEALAALDDETSALRAQILGRLAAALRDERDPARRVEIGERAVATARRTGDPEALSYALGGLCAAQHGFFDDARRLEVTEELRSVARAVGDRESECDALTGEILVFAARNEFGAVRDNAAAYAVLAEELRQPSQRWLSRAFDAMFALHAGRFDEAEVLVPEAYALGERAQSLEAHAAYAVQLYLLRRERGELEDAREPLARAAADSRARPFFRCALAALAVQLGDHLEARRLFEELAAGEFEIIPRDNEWLLAAAFLAEVARALDDTPRATALYGLLASFGDFSTSNPPEGTLGAVARTLGVLAATMGRRDEAVAHLRRAIEIDTAVGAPSWVAHAKAELAPLLGPSDGAAMRAETLDLASDLGMKRLTARIAASS